MPYIKKEHRKFYDADIKKMVKKVVDLEEESASSLPGEITYIVTKVLHQYGETLEESYSAYNTLIGILETAKLELYRSALGPYEDKKKKKHGKI